MSCNNGNVTVGNKVTVPTFGSEWVGEYFMLSYEGPDLKKGLNAAYVHDDLVATAECACKANAADTMRFDEVETCIDLSVKAGMATLNPANTEST